MLGREELMRLCRCGVAGQVGRPGPLPKVRIARIHLITCEQGLSNIERELVRWKLAANCRIPRLLFLDECPKGRWAALTKGTWSV